ncbi:hypothetical protein DFH07DRAFT_974574 [Mycena maculata]|uniref:CxC2-like cysteine cluster KDZ transposase-associated domain-containing protein n=1 Tax=Mycena maculata TaxID=230809 RepID=A0AAD7MEM0_9AGAR|nr:hypothetical protein DFH07DRAFT_974574 [Mycena maculata]
MASSRTKGSKAKRKELSAHGIHTHTHSFSTDQITGCTENLPITTFVDRASQDLRRSYRDEVPVEPPSPIKRFAAQKQAGASLSAEEPSASNEGNPADFGEFSPGQYGMDMDNGLDGGDEDDTSSGARRKKARHFNKPSLHRFRERRDEYLRTKLSRAGCMDASLDLCCVCKDPLAECRVRCRNCFGDDILCTACCVDRHAQNPFHHIERWNGKFFVRHTLKELGLRVQLGHLVGDRCPEPMCPNADFIVLHDNGIHQVNVDICDCENVALAGPPEIQMLRAGLFPATDEKPRTCATFQCLDAFLVSTLQAKTTMYDFYAMLEKMTDNTGKKPPNRYHAFLLMCRKYRHLVMLERGGRGHAPDGVQGTKPGELAMLCPCCPHPGINIPDGWENAPTEDHEQKDPSLGIGWAYLVKSMPYRGFLRTCTDQKEMNTCSGLAALDHANTKFLRGYSSTGVGMGVCTRHEFIQANGVGDLQKGERYVNMDYIFASILRHKDHRLLKIISYDIVCQWWKNLKARLKKLPKIVQIVVAMKLWQFVIPKMHIHSHTLACQLAYSLNLVPGSAQTDGEGIERPWAHIGPIAGSTREMGPGSREDVLNCHWSNWNWQKLVGLAERLRTRTDRTREEYAAQLEGFTSFSLLQQERVPAWGEMIEVFEADPKNAKNPYELPVKGATEAQVLLHFEEEDAARVASGVPGIHTGSPASFVAAALEVEDEQQRVRVQVELEKKGTTAQKIDIVASRRALTKNVWRLRTLQATYTPASIVALNAWPAPKDGDEEEPIEREPLFLPSALTAEPLKGLAMIEDSLRDAQCSTMLQLLRRQLNVKSRLLNYKKLHARNQGPNTRARTTVERNEMKIRLHSEKYQMAWEAKRRLVGGDPARVGWRLLMAEDIRCMEDAAELARGADKRMAQEARRREREQALRTAGELLPLTEVEQVAEGERAARGGENVGKVSWIWTVAGTAGTDADLEDALRIEWSKAYARTRRWREEECLLAEETRRLPVFLEFRAQEWEGRARVVPVGVWKAAEAEGGIVYALKQAAMFRDIGTRAEITRTELRVGRGKRRIQVVEDDLMDGEQRNVADEEEEGWAEEQEQLEELGGDVSDEEFLLGGGEDDE